NHHRWVNNNDIVTRVPPAWLGYRHTGEIMYLDFQGRLRKFNRARRARDRWRGLWTAIKQGRIDPLADHSMTCYVEGIANAMNEEPADGG
ncbi:MAG: lipase family protein, partial [Planctomycetota bacterium]